MKKYIFMFCLLFSTPIHSKPVDLYNECLYNKSYCYTYINGIKFGYNRGLYEGKKQFINCQNLNTEKIRNEFLRIFENNLYESSDDDGVLIINAMKSICNKK